VEQEIGLPKEDLSDLRRLDPAILVWLEKLGLWLSCAGIAVLGSMIIVTVVARYFVGSIIPDDLIIAGELMVTLVALPWAFVTADRGHIAVELFTNWATGRARILLDMFAALVGLVMVVPLTYATWMDLVTAIEYGSYFDGDLYLPEWPGRTMFFIGFALMLVRMLLVLITDLLRLYDYDEPKVKE
tara:strand:- start:418 stop:975 length:558 start_codon:yes stop_codon:yes gene_type:complete